MSPMFWSAKGRNVSTRTVVIGNFCYGAAILAVLVLSNPQGTLNVLRFAGMYVAPVVAIVTVIIALWFRELGRKDKETAKYSYMAALGLAVFAALLVVAIAFSYSS